MTGAGGDIARSLWRTPPAPFSYTSEQLLPERSDGMELTPEQDCKVKAIMAEMDCPKDFHCYEAKFTTRIHMVSATLI